MNSFSPTTFINIPHDVQLLIIDQLPIDSLVYLRHTCRLFFNLTNHHWRPVKNMMGPHTIFYSSAHHKFQTEHRQDPKKIVDSPTSRFWNNVTDFCLDVENVEEGDEENFLEQFKLMKMKFSEVNLYKVPLSIMDRFLSYLGGDSELHLYSGLFFSDEFLMTDFLKHQKSYTLISNNYEGPDNLPVKGINNVIKLWSYGIYNFDRLYIEHHDRDANMMKLLQDTKFKFIYKRRSPENTVLESFKQESYIESHVRNIRSMVAIKNASSDKCLLIHFKGNSIFMQTLKENDVVLTSINNLSFKSPIPHKFCPNFLSYFDHILRQPLFDDK